MSVSQFGLSLLINIIPLNYRPFCFCDCAYGGSGRCLTALRVSCRITKEPGPVETGPGSRNTAASYSPNWWVSTIGAGGLNFSVRNGKRWIPAAIATAYIT